MKRKLNDMGASCRLFQDDEEQTSEFFDNIEQRHIEISKEYDDFEYQQDLAHFKVAFDSEQLIYPATQTKHVKGWHGGNYRKSKLGCRIRRMREL